MPYTPTPFAPGVVPAATQQGNTDALRIYLHEGIATADLAGASGRWAQTRHVQPPVFEPYTGVQHGVTGHHGYQWAGGEGVRLTFLTSYLTGNGLVGAAPNAWAPVPGTAFTVDVRRQAQVLFHWWVEVETGPDDVPYTAGRTYQIDDRIAFIAPYISSGQLTQKVQAQECTQTQEGWRTTYPIGASRTYPCAAGYAQRDGVFAVKDQNVGQLTVGLAQYSQVDRAVGVNWGIAIETWYV